MEMEFDFVSPLLNDLSINEVENNFNVKIPNTLVNIIKKYNGGYPKNDTCVIDQFGETDVKSLLSFNKEDIENIYDVIDYFKNQFNGNLLPFATDSGSGYYCISEKGIVYYNEGTSNIYFIANTIEEFMKKLYMR